LVGISYWRDRIKVEIDDTYQIAIGGNIMKNRTTKETLMKFARRHTLDIDGYYESEKDRDPHKREINAIVRQLKAVRKQRDEFRLKASAYERIEQSYFDNDNYSDEQFMELIKETFEEVASDLEREE